MTKIQTEDDRIRASENFLFEFEGFLYFTDTYEQGRDQILTTKVKEKRIGIHRRSLIIKNVEFIEILKAYLKAYLKTK